ncbi:MAG TPA: NAD(P)H-dependent glycerol-3-phosphate dehydrogenase [Planctomycetota bacterium]|nr:NAD(P)H-dependent glycerol-3-phosphate dehydrogenase [Planctomycetota bacterium]
MKIVVIGDGAWSTTLAVLLAKKDFDVSLWTLFDEHAARLRRTRENVKFLPGVTLPHALEILSPESGSVGSFDLGVMVVPTQYIRTWLETARGCLGKLDTVVSGTKGIENGSLKRPTEIVAEMLAPSRIAVLSGPSHAEEVSRGLPTTVVAASDDPALAEDVQRTFSTDRFRVYTSTDTLGVELAGATKNVIAVAAGICDGLGFGDNSKAALLTRGLVEIARLGEALGAERATFAGLAGIGDLITTCYSPFGRNLAVGRALGKGERLDDVLERMAPVVAEGVPTTRSVREIARKRRVEMPITEEVHHILFDGKPPLAGVSDLMGRDLKPERD